MRSATPCPSSPGSLRTAILTTLALVAFAANSILCRGALGGLLIDAASFSLVRLASGAATLAILHAFMTGSVKRPSGSWASALLLLLYAVPFAFAYNTLGTATGALILFAAVQATMLVAALATGERPHRLQWLGFVVAAVGLVYLLLPGLEAPDPAGSVLMALAGVAWGFYSLRGRGSNDPLADSAGNFIRSVPMVALVSLASLSEFHISPTGGALAVASGALASGVGYSIWYAALRGLTATIAATVQLSVPIIAAVGGVLFMAEGITERLVLSSLLILGGVTMALLAGRRPSFKGG